MKKFFVFSLIISALCFLTSCEGPIGPEGPMGPEGPQGEGMNWEVLNIDVPSGSWKEFDGYLCSTVSVKQLTEFICNEGMVQAYIVYADGSQTILPATRYCSYLNDNNEPVYYQRLIDFEFSVGKVDLYYNITDFYYGDDWPDNMQLRLVLQW